VTPIPTPDGKRIGWLIASSDPLRSAPVLVLTDAQ
jgi:hypothetical protein